MCLNYIDVAVSATSLIEVTVFYTMTLPINPMLFRLLRIGKLVRAVRMVHMTNMQLARSEDATNNKGHFY